MRIMRIACCAAALMALTAAARAQSAEGKHATYLTFSAPVQVPGALLPAGTYLFQRAGTQTAGQTHTIQVFSEDGQHMIATFMTLPYEAADAPDRTVVMFAERAAGSPPAMRVWFYPGWKMGEEMIYPRDQALQFEGARHTSVLSTDANAPPKGTIATNGTPAASTVAVAPVIDRRETEGPPATAPVPAAAALAPRPRAVGTSGQADTARPKRTQLPQTAGAVELAELLSGASLRPPSAFAGSAGALKTE